MRVSVALPFAVVATLGASFTLSAQTLLIDDFTGNTIDASKWSTFHDSGGGSMTQNGSIIWDDAGSHSWTGHGLRTAQVFETGGVYVIEADYTVDDLSPQSGEGGSGINITRETPQREPTYYGQPLNSIVIDFNGRIAYVRNSYGDASYIQTKNAITPALKPSGPRNDIFYFLQQTTVHLRIEIDTNARTIKSWASGLSGTVSEAKYSAEIWSDVTGGTGEFRIEEFRSWFGDTDSYMEHSMDNWNLSQAGGPDLNAGLVAWYSFDEGNGIDSSGYGNHATPDGGISFVTGVQGSAAQFDGTSGYFSAPGNGELELTEWSLSCWVKPSAPIGTQTMLVGKPNHSDDRYNYYLSYAAGTQVRSRYESYATGETDYIVEGPNLALDTWTHVVSTRDSGGNHCLFINGELYDCEMQTAAPAANSAPLWMGMWYSSPLHLFFEGALDEVRVYDRALTIQEIQILSSAVPLSGFNSDSGFVREQDEFGFYNFGYNVSFLKLYQGKKLEWLGHCSGMAYAAALYYVLDWEPYPGERDKPCDPKPPLTNQQRLLVEAIQAKILGNPAMWDLAIELSTDKPSAGEVINRVALLNSAIESSGLPQPILLGLGASTSDWTWIKVFHTVLVDKVTEVYPGHIELELYDNNRPVCNTNSDWQGAPTISVDYIGGEWEVFYGEPWYGALYGGYDYDRFALMPQISYIDVGMAWILDSVSGTGETLKTASNVASLRVTAPDGSYLDSSNTYNSWGRYLTEDVDSDGIDEEIVALLEGEPGAYQIDILPVGDGGSEDAVSLSMAQLGTRQILAENLLVTEIPVNGFRSLGPAEAGVAYGISDALFAIIELPEGYDPLLIDEGSISLQGGVKAFQLSDETFDYDQDGLLERLAYFRLGEVAHSVSSADYEAVEVLLSGGLQGGGIFTGSDMIVVADVVTVFVDGFESSATAGWTSTVGNN